MALVFRLEVRGQAHVPASGPLLLVSNHVSLLDPPFVGAASPRELHFLAKEELFTIPLLGRLIRALNARPVKRDGSDGRALKMAVRLLGEGRALLVFPEGTRGVEGRLREGKPGAGMLAVMSGAPVARVRARVAGRPTGARDTQAREGPRELRAPLSFKSRADEGRKERYREATQEMMRAIAQLRDQTV
jgi:1-acyl-sn-glycerol-3-phosphate acyltransferase